MNRDDQLMSQKNSFIGVCYAIAAFTAWGFLPLYWKALEQVPAMEILAHRILWSFVFVLTAVLMYNRWKNFKEILLNKSNRLTILLSTLLISANWFIYIWAVNNEHVIDASLGYYINPLLTIFLAMVILKERLNFWQLISLVLALIGVLIITLKYAQIPWIALSLALTFAMYSLVKKLSNFDSVNGLALETITVVPISLIFIIFKQVDGTAAFGISSIYTTLLLIGAGVVTALPLLWFAQGARRVSLSTIGFIQYIAPSITLFLGVFLFKEPFTTLHVLSFGFIWCALTLYSLSQTRFMQNRQPKYFKNSKYYSEV